jgi:hypothetical protein
MTLPAQWKIGIEGPRMICVLLELRVPAQRR